MRYRLAYALILGLTLLWPAREVAGEGTLEHLLSEQRGPALYGDVTPADTTVPTEFDSGVALSVSVPRSPGSTDALFLDVSAQSLYMFTADPVRRVRVAVMIRLVSDALPPNIRVTRGAALANEETTNPAGEEDLNFRRSRRDVKFVLWRSRLSDFEFVNETTGEPLSEAQAISVQRRLINNGFTAELRTTGLIQGVSEHFGLGLTIEVTRALRGR
jgi:hypothetical protein